MAEHQQAERPIRICFVRLHPEKWLPVVGFEDLYEVSDLGNVRRSLNNLRFGRAPRAMRVHKYANCYPLVTLRVSIGNHRTRMVHDLVAAAHIGPRPKGLVINHKNGDRHDNRLANLEYVTLSQNLLHGHRLLALKKQNLAPVEGFSATQFGGAA